MKINLKFPLKNLAGVNLTENGKDISAGNILANILTSSSDTLFQPMIKAYDYALCAYRDGEIEIDNGDLQILQKIIENDKNYTILCKSQLWLGIKSQTENDKKSS